MRLIKIIYINLLHSFFGNFKTLLFNRVFVKNRILRNFYIFNNSNNFICNTCNSFIFLSNQNPDLEKLLVYGFEFFLFGVKFCVIGILFIMFDIEIMFLFSWCVTLAQLNLLEF